jgi:hypothetical protein
MTHHKLSCLTGSTVKVKTLPLPYLLLTLMTKHKLYGMNSHSRADVTLMSEEINILRSYLRKLGYVNLANICKVNIITQFPVVGNIKGLNMFVCGRVTIATHSQASRWSSQFYSVAHQSRSTIYVYQWTVFCFHEKLLFIFCECL